MADKTKIQWTDATWNPMAGCSRTSEGCRNCYAVRGAHRMAGHPNSKVSDRYEGLTVKDDGGQILWTGKVKLFTDRLDQPARWKRPRKIFVCSQSDLFHPRVPEWFHRCVVKIMQDTPRHTFQILTKHPERMAAVLPKIYGGHQPPENVWVGTTTEDNESLDQRLPFLARTPAAVRFLSMEPLLEDVLIGLLGICPKDWGRGYSCVADHIHQVIVGGESGPRARPFDPNWARCIRDECKDTFIAFYMKQMGAAWAKVNGCSDTKGGILEEMPEDLRIREFPEAA